MTVLPRRRFNATRIKVLREALGWSQSDLAKRLHVTKQAVSLWEQGRLEPRINTLVRLAEATGARLETFLVLDEAHNQGVGGGNGPEGPRGGPTKGEVATDAPPRLRRAHRPRQRQVAAK